MLTIIDALVIELSLDDANYNDGQKRAVDSLRKLESSAQQSAGRVRQSGTGVVSFFRALENPIGSLRHHFEALATSTHRPRHDLADLAAQGRRTGAGIEAGALAGAAGLRVMGAAGIGALAVLELLNKAKNAANEAATKTFGSALGAAAAGVPIQDFTAMSQALLHRGNVPEEVTQGWMARLRAAQVQAAAGHPEEAIALNTAFAQAGIQANALSDKPEQVMAAIAKRFHEVSADVAIGLGDLIGQSAALAKALHDLGDKELEAQVAAERQRAATEKDSAAANELVQSQNNLANATSHLGRAITDFLSGPMAEFNNWVAFLRDHLANLLQGKGWTGPDVEGQQKTPEATAPIPPRAGAGAGAGTPVPTGGKNDVTEEKLRSFGIDPATAAALNYISHSETPQGSVLNSVGASRGVSPTQSFGYTAQGYWQMLNSNWRKYAGQLGFYPQYQNALAAPMEVQAKVAALMYKTEGPAPWMSAAGGSINAGRLRGIQEAQARAASGSGSLSIIPSAEAAISPPDHPALNRGFLVPPGTKFNSQGQPYAADLNTMSAEEKARVEQSMAAIRAAQRSGKPWYQKVGDQLSLIQSNKAGDSTTTTHNTTNADTNVGDIHVHVPAGSDGYVIGGAVNDAIQRRGSLATQANTGLQ